MKKQTTLGAAIKEARESLGLTQRGLAAEIDVKASHVAYIESNRRRPSLPLLRKLVLVLGLNRREMLFLSYPDAKFLIDDATGVAKREKAAWEQFASNRAMLRRYSVTRAELKVLKEVSLLEHVSSPRHFLFVLNAIRQAGEL
jgi:transcriptional regulator with XRE-family HTH domain